MFRRENPFGGAPLLFFAPRRCDFLQERQVDSLSLPRFARELELAPYYFIVFIVYRVQLLPCTTYPNASRLVASLSSCRRLVHACVQSTRIRSACAATDHVDRTDIRCYVLYQARKCKVRIYCANPYKSLQNTSHVECHPVVIQ